MASSAHRNVAQRGNLKLDRPLNLRTSFKSRLPQQSSGSAIRRSSPASFGTGGYKDDGGSSFVDFNFLIQMQVRLNALRIILLFIAYHYYYYY